jgi:vancomycin permeability regulator SanA
MPGGLFGFLALCREQFARVRAVLDAYLLDTPPEYLDGKVRIAPDG